MLFQFFVTAPFHDDSRDGISIKHRVGSLQRYPLTSPIAILHSSNLKKYHKMFRYFATILAVVAIAKGFPTGAPVSACKNMIPGHGVEPQASPAPFIVTPSTKEVKAGTPMEVTVSGRTPTDKIRGLMLQARVGDKIVGTFNVEPDHPIAKTMTCDVKGDTITHKFHDEKYDQNSVTFTWTPPADLNDNIKFRATIVVNYSVFWVGVESASVKVIQ